MDLVYRKLAARTMADGAGFDVTLARHELGMTLDRVIGVTGGTGCRDGLNHLYRLAFLRNGGRQGGGRQWEREAGTGMALAAVPLPARCWKNDFRCACHGPTDELGGRVTFRAHVETVDHVFEMDRLGRHLVFGSSRLIGRIGIVAQNAVLGTAA